MTNNLIRNSMAAAVAASTLFSAMSFVSSGASAQAARCGKHADVVAFLGKKFKETKKGMGLINAGQMMELYISDAGSWTVLITRPDGVTCFGPVGKNWMGSRPKSARAEVGA